MAPCDWCRWRGIAGSCPGARYCTRRNEPCATCRDAGLQCMGVEPGGQWRCADADFHFLRRPWQREGCAWRLPVSVQGMHAACDMELLSHAFGTPLRESR